MTWTGSRSKGYLPTVSIGLIQAVLTIILVWYHLSRNPELRMLGPHIQPVKAGRNVATDEHLRWVRLGKTEVQIARPTPTRWRFKGAWKVECGQRRAKLM